MFTVFTKTLDLNVPTITIEYEESWKLRSRAALGGPHNSGTERRNWENSSTGKAMHSCHCCCTLKVKTRPFLSESPRSAMPPESGKWMNTHQPGFLLHSSPYLFYY